MGPSGCGKTTLLRIIGDLLTPSSGSVRIGGMHSSEARHLQLFSWVFQNPALLPWRTALANVKLPQEIVKHPAANAKGLLETMGLTNSAHMYPDQLSGGMQQRVAIARALAISPSVLLMDEPFGNLDELTRERLNEELLRSWSNAKITVIFVTHSVAEAVFLSDRVVVLSKRPGRIVKEAKVNFPRPRVANLRSLKDFTDLVADLRGHL